jgi:hypothetical protein
MYYIINFYSNYIKMEFRRRENIDKLELRIKMFELRLKYIEEILLESIVKLNDIEIDQEELSKSLSNPKLAHQSKSSESSESSLPIDAK